MAPSAVIAAADAAGTPSYRAVLAHPRLMAAQLVSIAMIGGHFTLFAYLTPYLQAVLSPGAAALEGLYVAFGIAGVTGAWLGGLFSDRLGASRALACPAMFLVAMAVLPAASVAARVRTRDDAGGGISWSISPIVQNYLIHTAPSLADASVGINVSAMHAVSHSARRSAACSSNATRCASRRGPDAAVAVALMHRGMAARQAASAP